MHPAIESFLLRFKRRRLIVIVAPIALGLLAGGALIVKPAIQRITGIKSELAGLARKATSYKYILDTESRMEAYRAKLSKPGDKTWLIEQLNLIGDKTNVSIVSIVPEESKKVGDYLDRTSVRIEAEAGYHDLGEFVSRVENLEPLVKILELGIQIDDEEGVASPGGFQAAARKPNTYRVLMSVGLFAPVAGAL